MLESRGFRVFAAADGPDGIEIFKRDPHAIDVVLLDLTMPGMDGGEVFTALRRIRQDLKVVLCSGFSVEGKARQIMNQGACAFIQKPFDIQSLLKTISGVLVK